MLNSFEYLQDSMSFSKNNMLRLLTRLYLVTNCVFLVAFEAVNAETNDVKPPQLIMQDLSANDFYKNLEEAIMNHPIFLGSEASVAQSRELVNIAKSARRPQLSMQSSATNRLSSSYDGKLSFFESSPIKERASASLVIDQLLFDFFATSYQIEQQESTLLADQTLQEQKVNNLALKMITSCLDTATYFILKTMVLDSVNRHQEITDKIKVRVDSGRAPMRELSRANARLAEAQAKQANIDLNYQSVLAEFKQLMPDSKACMKMLSLEKAYLVMQLDQAIDQAINSNLNIKEANLRIKAAEENLLRVKSSRWPRLTLKVQGDKYNPDSYGFWPITTHSLEEYDFYAGVNLEADIYSGGRKKSQIRAANQELNVLLYEKNSLVKTIKSNTERLISELESGDERIDIFLKAFIANQRSRDNLTLQFQTSNISLLDLLQAERDYLESSENMVFNQRAVLLSSYTQLAILGRLLNYVSDQSDKIQ